IASPSGGPNHSLAFSQHRRAARFLFPNQPPSRSTRLRRPPVRLGPTAWRATARDFFRDAFPTGEESDARSLCRALEPLSGLHPTKLSKSRSHLSAAPFRKRRGK